MPDYTQAVFLKNILHLSEDLINGTGVLDYFAGVLGIHGAVQADGVPGVQPDELPGGKLPDQLVPLFDERLALEGIDETAHAVIIIEEGPPSLDELILRQRAELRNWFFASAEDHVVPEGAAEPPESVQFRVAKVARVLGPDILPGELTELVSQIPNTLEGDTLFDKLLIEALTDYIRWHGEVAVFGYEPVDIVAPLPGEPINPETLGSARLQKVENALVEALGEAVDRAIDRATSRIGTDAASTDIDAMLQDAVNAMAWSAEAARLATLVPGTDTRPFDEQAEITLDEVLRRLPFHLVIQSAELTGPADDAILTVQAGIEIDNPDGGTFPPIPHQLVHVLVQPGPNTDIEGLAANVATISNPRIAKRVGAVDATGRFVTRAELGPVDRDLSLVVSATLEGLLGFEQTTVTKKGDVKIDIQGFLPVASSSEDTLRDGLIVVPNGHDVQLVAEVKRGNGPLAQRNVSFFLLGTGTLTDVVSQTDRDGTAISHFSAPTGSEASTLSVGAAYFEDGVIYSDHVEIHHARSAAVVEQLGSILPSGFASLPPSEAEDAFVGVVESIQAANEDPITLADLSDNQKDGLVPLLKTWFEQVVIPGLDEGTASDSAMSRALRDYIGWKTHVQLLDLEESSIIPAGNAGGDLNNAHALLVVGLRNAILRAQSRMAGATSLVPLYEALQWFADGALVGVDTEELQLTFNDIIQQVGITIDLSNVQLTGSADNATLSADVALKIDNVVPDFDVPIQLTVLPAGSSRVDTPRADINTTGHFSALARIGPRESELELVLQAGIVGIDLATVTATLVGEARIELSGFEGNNATEAKSGPISLKPGDIAGIQVEHLPGQRTAARCRPATETARPRPARILDPQFGTFGWWHYRILSAALRHRWHGDCHGLICRRRSWSRTSGYRDSVRPLHGIG